MTLLEKIEKEYEYGEPIFIAELSYGKYPYNSVKAMLSKYVKKGYLKRYCSGVYYRFKKDKYGDTCLDYDLFLKRKYLESDDDIYGYYSGITLLNDCGLSTQVPYIKEIITNKETNIKRNVTQGSNNIILRRPNIKITKDNYRYLQFADIMKCLAFYNIDKYNQELKEVYNSWKLDRNILDDFMKTQKRTIKSNYMRFLQNNELA